MSCLFLLERDLLPDALIRFGIHRLLRRRLADEAAADRAAGGRRAEQLIEELRRSPVALHTDAANEQHYEVPAEFFRAVLGPRLKYSSCFYPNGVTVLAAAEEAMLALTCERAQIVNGQDVLELGCGWGSLTLYIAEKFPACRITAVSNSISQKVFIDAEAARRGVRNVEIVTSDINDFAPGRVFDRVVSVEMFEHVRNYDALLRRIASWLKPEGLLFVHIFCHAKYAYPFEVDGDDDWMARYFFTGGLMPSDDLLLSFQEAVVLTDRWIVNGRHYEKTCYDWLANMDRNRERIMPVLAATYGSDQTVRWWVFWRVFFMSCAELFGFSDGNEWHVAHYLFRRR